VRWRGGALLALLVGALSACSSIEPYDYTAFRANPPRSILVLPPLDDTMEVEPSYAYLSTVSHPLGELGYYVFPVAVVSKMMQDNGLPGPAEMHSVSLAKVDEIFGADAVLYMVLSNWGTSYQVIDSSTTVSVEARLVDVATGIELWGGSATGRISSSSGQSGLIGMLVGAVVNQIAATISDPSLEVARRANAGLFGDRHRGLLHGPYHELWGTGPEG